MREAHPVPLAALEAAERLHERITAWRDSDLAMDTLRVKVPGFTSPDTLLKVAVVNALYSTNVYAIARVADHFTRVLSASDLAEATPALVEQLAAVPRGGSEKRPSKRTSLASKFAHFFISPDRFPIYDQYAVRMLSHHVGVPGSSLDGNYPEFARRFDSLADCIGLTAGRRRLDRYLWVQGQYERWRAKPNEVSSELRPYFERGEWAVRSA